MLRALFQKSGNAVWISHLDLMRLFQRAFKRANLPLTHTHGFNPRPSVSIALPLSVGIESRCELLDFDLDMPTVSPDEICTRLNKKLIDGIRVLQVYEAETKIKDLSLLKCEIICEYDRGVPENCTEKIQALFSNESLIVPKKSKSGFVDQNIIPMIHEISCSQKSENQIRIDGIICCQNPTLNPTQIAAAIERCLPEYKPDFFICRRIEIFDQNKNIFR